MAERFRLRRNVTNGGRPVGGVNQNPPRANAGYSAFVSYSHAADDQLAPAVQHALSTFAKPWYRLRAMRVFRDKTNLSASPGLWQSIEIALGQSEWFLFMASPRAAQSHWVEQEITWWLRNRGLPWHSRGERAVFGFVLPGRPFKVVTYTYNNQRASRFALRKSMREPTATGS